MAALMEGEPYELKWNDDAVLGVVIASEGYPDKVIKGARLPELNVITAQGLDVFHAGTKSDGKDFVGNGGRVLLVAARAETLKDAQADVYHSLSDLKWDGFFYRTDIGWRTFE